MNTDLHYADDLPLPPPAFTPDLRLGPTRVRPALPDDAPAMGEINVLSWRAAYRDIVPHTFLDALSIPDQSSRHLKRLLNLTNLHLLLELDSRPIGYLSAGPSRDNDAPPATAEIYAIYLLPDAWSKGLGSLLLTTALDALAARQLRHTQLWVLKSNTRARAFYERHAFTPDPTESPLDVGNTQLPGLRYTRPLGG